MATRTNRWYVSLDVAKRVFLNIDLTETSQDARVKDLIRQASDWIEEEIGTYFYPVVETRHFDHAWDTGWLKLDQWLLTVTTGGFKTKNGATTVNAADYYLMQHNNYNESPYNAILMKALTTLTYTGTPRQANSILGQWGYCDDTESTGATVLNDPLAAGGTSLTVLTGLLEIGWMLLVGSEQIFVSSITAGSPNDTVTIVRAQGGTTAAEHAQGTAISRYVPPDDVETLCGIIVGRLYHRGGTKWTDIPPGPDQGIIYFQDMPAEAKRIIRKYKREWTR